MSESSARGILTIDLGAVAANWQALARRTAPSACGAVVKADAYGLGVARVAPALFAAGCRTYFVASVEEGVELRGILGPDPAILVLNGPEPVRDARAHDLIPVLNSPAQIDTWIATGRAASAVLPAAVHVDTGMNRLGLSAHETAEFAVDRARRDGIDVVLVMSHLACAEDTAHPMNRHQLTDFLRRIAALPAAPASLANSAGILLGQPYHFQLSRPGIALYGGQVSSDPPLAMTEVVHLQGKIVQVRRVDTPESVGYGAAFHVSGPSRIATVAVGYADGYPRSAGAQGSDLARGSVIVSGMRVPIVGRVSMDLITIDVTAVPESAAHSGALVSLIGRGMALDEVASAAGTISYEILTSLGPRYERRYLEG